MQNLANFAVEKRTDFKNNFKEQIFANELRHHYNLRQPKGERPTMVFLVVRINNQQVKISTGMKVYPMHWNKNRAKEGTGLLYLENNNNRLLNERLSLLDLRFDEYKRLVNDGIVAIDREVLKEYILTGKIMAKKKKKEKIDIAKVILSYLDKDTSIKGGTKANYTRFINSFGEYLSSCDIHSYSALTLEIMKGFQQWCIDNTVGRNGEKASGASINKKVKCTYKCIRKYLVNNSLMSGSQLADIQVEPLKEVAIDDEIALRDDELTLLYNFKCENKRDEEIRDLFLLECTTGQRFSDVEKVDDLLEQKDERTYINLIQEKGGAKVQVDIIFQMALDILEKYKFQLPTYNKKIFNKRIKEIAKSAGVKGQELIRYHEAGIAGVSSFTKERYECISSHTGRRTFVTLLSLRGMNETEIARYTGHSTLTMVRLYDKSKEGTKVKEMYERLKKEHPEQILQRVGDDTVATPQQNSYVPNIAEIIELVRQNENSKATIEHLNTELTSSHHKISNLKNILEIENFISSVKHQSEKEKAELIEELMKMGYTYQDYQTLLGYQSKLEDEISMVDSIEDTLLDV